MAMIKCSNASFVYDGKTVVSDLTFEVSAGDYLCIVGENGSGKSTLLAGLLGLKKAAGGAISMGDGLCRTDIGYLPQQSLIQREFPASVSEVVLSGCLNSVSLLPFFGKKHKAEALKNMERLGLTDLKHRCYKELSGGQQQRVLLARTLCAAKKLLILDEPVSGLDPVVSEELYALIHRFNLEMNMTVIMVSHDLHGAVKYASKILHLDGHPLFFGDTAEYETSAIGKRFLGGYENV